MAGERDRPRGVRRAPIRKDKDLYKVVVLGDGGVGKSALTMQFVSSRFVDVHDPTIEDAYRQQTVVDSEVAHLDILDTAGQREFTAMREQYMRSGEGFIICYSITDRKTFEEAITYKTLIERVRCSEDIAVVLVANKSDLEEEREVSKEDGEALSRSFGCPLFETSAATRQQVDEAFHSIVREIRRLERLGDGSKLSKKSTFKRLFKRLSIKKKASK